ncbi:regulator of G-protein signaling 17 isoform X1 [Tribolium castaneum]|uniref:regulator of G-protein signaling 17 isoform X1 n=1 Tax=Tribolium castaneum TaxID=7070 RepID=UPI00046C2050|nr:PREDICTED: regulator of G-protein signaling 17 isoform X1 [Tribolium castaneum]XP_015836108.1 PREDICTED: regulator of G-protein signaling 17 isoform X1 [Tribolium castaneum]XP_015836110.1 PREDICTED: regulator of G-protein signaling 17 isoform X1 [Tribolium castaneum]|eukprot:XP_008193476.1 PREDICTED: regulator of G-protein signaling 17 isoform X1 [Tribolium castaneum]
MSCSVTERVTENRAGPGGGPATGAGAPAGAGCRLRGSSSASLSTPPNSRGGPPASAGSQSGGPQNGPQPGQGAPLRPKPCCLCWCCCCSCSCSTPGKGNDENGPTRNSNNSDLLNYDGDPPPSLEEIRSWGRSFDKLMRSPVRFYSFLAGRKVFRDFLRCEYSEENILFWLACEDLKKENNPEAVEEKARIIYEDYISILSPKEVSLDARVREIVNRNMVEPTPHTFDDAQLQIYTLMHRDSYPRFVNSPLYRSLAQQQPPSQQQQQQQQQGEKDERSSIAPDQDGPGPHG